MENIISIIFLVALSVIAILICFCMIKAVKGPSVTDRIVAINMIGTLVIIEISVLAIYLNESGLLDVSLIYACMSFLAVVVLTKIYLGVYIERMKRKKLEQSKEEDSKQEENKISLNAKDDKENSYSLNEEDDKENSNSLNAKDNKENSNSLNEENEKTKN